ncbi:MAG: pirin family protein [Chitinophagales bacterium]
MNRKKFLKNSLLGLATTTGVTALASQTSTYSRLMEQVGFNHLPNKEEKTMKTVLHKAQTRGYANHGWLESHHSFSFANYYNPQRMNFGVLRVLNDDSVAAARGFNTHPHDNMEIISIPLEGDLEHKDSIGNLGIIKEGDVQIMSAGTGIFHSEKNRNKDKEVKFLQIWMFPNKQNVRPRYDQITLNKSSQNQLQQILSPSADDEGVWAHQNAWFHMGSLEKGKRISYEVNAPKTNGVYAFVLEGSINIEGQKLGKRDGFGLWETEAFDIEVSEDARVLLMEVPMAVS